MSDHSPEREARREAWSIAAVYAAVAGVWIVASDLLLGPDVPTQETHLDVFKGLAFVGVTATALYLWIRRKAGRRAALVDQYRSLAERAPDLVYRLRLRPEPRFDYVSRTAEALTGRTPDEFYADARGSLDALHPDDRHRMVQLVEEPEAAEDTVELRWIHPDGRVTWTENRFTPIRDDAGDIVGAQGIARDITHRKQAQHLNELLATAVEGTGEAVIITDRNGAIEYVNPAFTAISGWEPDEVRGKTPQILKSGHQPESYYQELWNTISSGRTFRGEMVNRRKDGRLYDQECTITPVTDDRGEVTHYVAVARDVTVQREMDERVKVAQKMQAVGQLAAGIAHDFRNLLNVIQANAEALERRKSAPDDAPSTLSTEDRERVREIRDATTRGSTLVGRVLTVGRRDELTLASTDLAEVISRLRTSFDTLLPEGVTLNLEVAGDLPPILADTTALEQIFLNLVINAGDALDEGDGGGRVDVRVEEVPPSSPVSDMGDGRFHHGRYLRVAVEDTGRGMSDETLRRVFEPFFTTKPEGQGTGLGLATVRSLVERHGGVVSVESRPGIGTTFELFFPTAPDADTLATQEDEEPVRDLTGVPRGTESILLVEDEDALRTVGVRILSMLGYTVDSATDGEEALEWLSGRAGEVDLVVTDLVMPRMGGMTLFERSRERGWGLPFLFMSGYGAEDSSWHPNPDRLRVVLEKPWTMSELAHRVRDVLDTGRPL